MNCLIKKFFKAGIIGSSVPSGNFLVKVHSVFQKAINLQLFEIPSLKQNASLSKNDFITILSNNSINHPKSICLTTIEDFTIYNLGLNTSGGFDMNGITIGNPNCSTLFYISFSEANRLTNQPLPSIANLGKAWETSVALLSAMQIKAKTSLNIANLINNYIAFDVLSGPLTNAALALGQLVTKGNISNLHTTISKLIGFGHGLTPSGDDFLCGFITAAHCRCGVNLEYLLELNNIIKTKLANTNLISANLLLSAIEKDVCSALHDFAKAIYEDTCSKNALINLSTLGHSSGMDIATGFLYGLLVWGN